MAPGADLQSAQPQERLESRSLGLGILSRHSKSYAKIPKTEPLLGMEMHFTWFQRFEVQVKTSAPSVWAALSVQGGADLLCYHRAERCRLVQVGWTFDTAAQ